VYEFLSEHNQKFFAQPLIHSFVTNHLKSMKHKLVAFMNK